MRCGKREIKGMMEEAGELEEEKRKKWGGKGNYWTTSYGRKVPERRPPQEAGITNPGTCGFPLYALGSSVCQISLI